MEWRSRICRVIKLDLLSSSFITCPTIALELKCFNCLALSIMSMTRYQVFLACWRPARSVFIISFTIGLYDWNIALASVGGYHVFLLNMIKTKSKSQRLSVICSKHDHVFVVVVCEECVWVWTIGHVIKMGQVPGQWPLSAAPRL